MTRPKATEVGDINIILDAKKGKVAFSLTDRATALLATKQLMEDFLEALLNSPTFNGED